MHVLLKKYETINYSHQKIAFISVGQWSPGQFTQLQGVKKNGLEGLKVFW